MQTKSFTVRTDLHAGACQNRDTQCRLIGPDREMLFNSCRKPYPYAGWDCREIARKAGLSPDKCKTCYD